VLSTLKSCPTRKELLNSKRAAQFQKSCSTPKEPLNSERAVNSKKAAQLRKSCSIPKELLNSKRTAQLQRSRSTPKDPLNSERAVNPKKPHYAYKFNFKRAFLNFIGHYQKQPKFQRKKNPKISTTKKETSKSCKNLKSPKSDKNRRKSLIQEKDTTEHQVEQPAINGGFRKR
jgi:hypothetical protein